MSDEINRVIALLVAEKMKSVIVELKRKDALPEHQDGCFDALLSLFSSVLPAIKNTLH